MNTKQARERMKAEQGRGGNRHIHRWSLGEKSQRYGGGSPEAVGKREKSVSERKEGVFQKSGSRREQKLSALILIQSKQKLDGSGGDDHTQLFSEFLM